MLQRMLKIPKEKMPKFLDATDGLAAAYCHFLQMGRPTAQKAYGGWKDFMAKNPSRIATKKTKDTEVFKETRRNNILPKK